MSRWREKDRMLPARQTAEERGWPTPVEVYSDRWVRPKTITEWDGDHCHLSETYRGGKSGGWVKKLPPDIRIVGDRGEE